MLQEAVIVINYLVTVLILCFRSKEKKSNLLLSRGILKNSRFIKSPFDRMFQSVSGSILKQELLQLNMPEIAFLSYQTSRNLGRQLSTVLSLTQLNEKK